MFGWIWGDNPEATWVERNSFFWYSPKCVTINEFNRELQPILYVPSEVVEETEVLYTDHVPIICYTKWYCEVFKGNKARMEFKQRSSDVQAGVLQVLLVSNDICFSNGDIKVAISAPLNPLKTYSWVPGNIIL